MFVKYLVAFFSCFFWGGGVEFYLKIMRDIRDNVTSGLDK